MSPVSSSSRSNEDRDGVKIETKFYDDWVAKNVPDQTGKVAIITGGNSGVGFWIGRTLASKGCQVILACRDIGKGAAARNDIQKDYPSAQVHCMLLDLMDLSWVRAFCAEFLDHYDTLNYLINNAGVMAERAGLSVDGHDIQMQTNHLGHFLLTKLLWERLVESPGQSRVIQHSCVSYWLNGPIFNRDKYPHYSSSIMQGRFIKRLLGYKPIDRWMRYGVSKLANLLFMRELQRKIDNRRMTDQVISVAAHAGLASSNLQLSSQDALPSNWRRTLSRQGQSAADGCLPLLMACVSPEVQNGDFLGPSGPYELTGPPCKVPIWGTSVNDEDQGETLWDHSEDCVLDAFNV